MAKQHGIEQILVHLKETKNLDFMENRINRCYICKRLLFEKIKEIASSMNIACIVHGENVDDLSDFRPGFAAAQEMGIKAPLIDAG
eukprot:CAMPEP_0201284754 /NCGR_PEP_ID=MMETSP1317-20130820/83707_1 /ASSEMBLY_ACC=CAM_ASM_000770 /TAXON_ID=187299 /ORGANISM="Undescribed Undescribed, Strain Undescribed" /LENGTH=85 /DNA_ID=CAMNT_0047606165 /DNA_START=187 /DNA_END=441 /DNA_ORIENTATION=+